MDQLAEYSVQGQKIGHGSRVGTTTITTPDPGASVDDSAIQQMLNTNIANNRALEAPTYRLGLSSYNSPSTPTL
jgi:hypothetical protein